MPCTQTESSPVAIIGQLLFGQIEPDQDFEVRGRNRFVIARDDDPLQHFCRARDRTVGKISANGEIFLVQHFAAAPRDRDPIAIIIAVRRTRRAFAEGKINLDFSPNRVIPRISAIQAYIDDLAGIFNIREQLSA